MASWNTRFLSSSEVMQSAFHIYELLFITVRVIVITFIWSPMTVSDLLAVELSGSAGPSFSRLTFCYFSTDALFSACVFLGIASSSPLFTLFSHPDSELLFLCARVS